MKKLLFTIALLIPVVAWGKQCQSDYPPAKLAQGTIPNIHPGLVFVEPPYAGFDPCNSTVEIKVNEKSDTFVLVLHGSGGSDNSQIGVAKRFEKAGFSVLYFDAFKMNKINRDALFWSTQVHAGSTARMLYFSGLAAIKWMTVNHPERSKKIVVYGFSMGGMAAINLAATEGLDAVTQAIAEAPANNGIGLPDKLLKPVSIFYGTQDNYGGLSLDEFLWKRRSPCLWGAPIENTPVGNAASCNYFKYERGQRTQSVEDWVGEQKNKGTHITFQFIEGAGHAMFNGRFIETATRSTPSGIKFYSTTGSQIGVADKAFQDVLGMIK